MLRFIFAYGMHYWWVVIIAGLVIFGSKFLLIEKFVKYFHWAGIVIAIMGIIFLLLKLFWIWLFPDSM